MARDATAQTGMYATSDEASVTRRAKLRTMLHRRRRFWRRIVTFVIVTTIMVTTALLNRDTLRLKDIRREGELIASTLQDVYQRRNHLPIRFPDVPGADPDLRKNYYFNVMYSLDRQSVRRVGVCCSKDPAHFYLRSDGRIVVLFDGEKFESHWIPEHEFRHKSEQLGLASVLKG